MIKSLLLKLLTSVMVEKIKTWFEKVGLTSILYLIVAVVVFLFGGLIPIIGGFKQELFGASLGVFVYINWNIITKLYNNKVKSKIDELTDKISNRIEEIL